MDHPTRHPTPANRILLQPVTRAITQEQLINEVKGIYAGLFMVEKTCLETRTIQPISNEQWQALIALHRTLLHEHHDFFLASQCPTSFQERHEFFLATQHPTASPALRRLATKYAMPARMWRHGIHSFLELLRHRLPDSLDHMLAFIYLAYSMMAPLIESIPSFVETWIECLGNLARYRMAIEEVNLRDREIWSNVARMWYNKAADRYPNVGRIQHHLAVLARPNIVHQSFYYSKALVCIIRLASAGESPQPPFPSSLKSGVPKPCLKSGGCASFTFNYKTEAPEAVFGFVAGPLGSTADGFPVTTPQSAIDSQALPTVPSPSPSIPLCRPRYPSNKLLHSQPLRMSWLLTIWMFAQLALVSALPVPPGHQDRAAVGDDVRAFWLSLLTLAFRWIPPISTSAVVLYFAQHKTTANPQLGFGFLSVAGAMAMLAVADENTLSTEIRFCLVVDEAFLLWRYGAVSSLCSFHDLSWLAVVISCGIFPTAFVCYLISPSQGIDSALFNRLLSLCLWLSITVLSLIRPNVRRFGHWLALWLQQI